MRGLEVGWDGVQDHGQHRQHRRCELPTVKTKQSNGLQLHGIHHAKQDNALYNGVRSPTHGRAAVQGNSQEGYSEAGSCKGSSPDPYFDHTIEDKLLCFIQLFLLLHLAKDERYTSNNGCLCCSVCRKRIGVVLHSAALPHTSRHQTPARSVTKSTAFDGEWKRLEASGKASSWL
ncbi:uncharacterized protein V6R79_012438 [Siganus canaliculatus]